MLLLQATEFEVATFKPSPPSTGDSISINLGKFENNTLTLSNASISDYLKLAFNLASDSQLVGPDWIRNKTIRFDMTAKFAPGTSRRDAGKMLQALLVERLGLRWHTETRVVSHLALVVAKGGPKLRAAGDPSVVTASYQRTGRISHSDTDLDLLTRLLSRFEDQPVLDETGLTGRYALVLEWLPESKANAPDAADGPSLYTAVQEQLGLRLIPRKSPIDVIVVDSVERTPTQN